MTNEKAPERVWINSLPESGRVTAYVSPIREVGSGRSLSLAEYIRADLLATARAEEREAAWQPIETADPEIPALLFTPARRLWNDPTDKPIDIRVAKPRDWTWATHWQPLPDTAALEAATY